MPKFFAWVKGGKGPTPVLFHHGLPTNGNGKVQNQGILKVKELHLSEYALKLSELETKYPYEKESSK
jgi:hypothetical protein